MSPRRAGTKITALRYARSDSAAKKVVLDEAYALTHRDHARKTLLQALVLKPVKPTPAKPPLYGKEVIEALRLCWAAQGTPWGRLLAAAPPDLVPRLRRFKALSFDDATDTGAEAEHSPENNFLLLAVAFRHADSNKGLFEYATPRNPNDLGRVQWIFTGTTNHALSRERPVMGSL